MATSPLLVIPQERAERASVGIGVRHAMRSPFTVKEVRHRGRDGVPDTRALRALLRDDEEGAPRALLRDDEGAAGAGPHTPATRGPSWRA